MTAEEIIAEERKKTYSCRGWIGDHARAWVNTMLRDPDLRPLAYDVDLVNRRRDPNKPFVVSVEKLDDPDKPLLLHLSDGKTEEFKGSNLCGSDFLKHLILSSPFDGEARPYRCPQCGVTGIFRSPKADS